MREFIPPACLVLTLFLLIGAVANLARERPAPSMELHQARLGDDEEYRERLEAQWERRKLHRRLLIGSLFGLALITAAAGMVAMRPAES